MNSAAAAPSRVRPRRRGVFPAVRRSGAARRSSARGANANSAGQILSLVRRFGRPSPWGAFSRGANPFARAPCREAFAVGSVSARGKSFRPCAVSGGLRRGERSCAGQILSLVRRVGRPSPWGAFLRGANPFARAPCREAFAEGSVLAWGKFCPPPRAIGKPPRAVGKLRRGGLSARPRRAKRPPCRSPKSAPAAAETPPPRRHPPRRGHGRGAPHTARACSTARASSSSASARSAARRSCCDSSSRRSFI